MAKHAFDKFMNKEVTGAKKKEALRQEKRKVKAQLRAEGEEFRRKKLEKLRGINSDRNGEDRRQNAGDRNNRTGDRVWKGDDRRKNTGDRRQKGEDRRQKTGDRRKETEFGAKNFRQDKKKIEVKKKDFTRGSEEKFKSNETTFKTERSSINKQPTSNNNKRNSTGKRSINQHPTTSNYKKSSFSKPEQPRYKQGKPVQKTYEQITQKPATDNKQQSAELMPLNKFIAHSGVCGRREAAEMVKEGKVQVNGSIVYEPGYKVSAKDKVLVKDKQVFIQKNLVYILLNKPKDYITTVEDPQGRKTVLDLIKEASKDRVYPVGRLDRNTTGVLLLTNDGELAQKLTHPSYEIKKLYEVTLDKPLIKKDAENILSGITLEDGFVKADALGYADAKDKSIIGVEIHSGRNRIVRRIFEHLGYKVKNLDRVMFANLTKKNVERGKWRFLNEKEIRLLKYMNQSFVKKPA